MGSPADDLAQGGEIGPNPVELLRAAQSHAEPGHHFIQNEQRPMACCGVAQPFEKPRRRRNAAHVAHHRLDDRCRNAVPMRAKSLLQGIRRVERQGDRRVAKALRNPRRIW